MPTLLHLLRVYVAITVYTALCSMVQDYLGSANLKVTYGENPLQVTYLTSRILCMFHFLCVVVRAAFIYYPRNAALYFLVMATYYQTVSHYSAEYFVFGTLAFIRQNLPPIIISVVWFHIMAVAYLSKGDFKSMDEPEPVKEENEKKTK